MFVLFVLTDNPEDSTMWMFIDGKGLELTTYFVILVLYIKLKFHLKEKVREIAPSRPLIITSTMAKNLF